MSVYYNEIDPFAAAWLRNLMAEKLIPVGVVDERSIVEVEPRDLIGFTQCHFFAGIGGWAYALHLAGWGDRPVWTASCPCQPFSLAGDRKGTKDIRDLWPAFFRLVRERRPVEIFGEQVESAIRWGWYDRLADDLESATYTVGALVLHARGFGALHRRDRLYWAAGSNPDCLRPQGQRPAAEEPWSWEQFEGLGSGRTTAFYTRRFDWWPI